MRSELLLRLGVLLPLSLLALSAAPADATIPYFARRYSTECGTCHVHPPKLNEFGEAFRQNGYRMPDGGAPRRTVPLAIWASARSDAFPDEPEVREAVRGYVNKLEVISGGQIGPGVSYFVEWRPISLEPQTRDGTVRLRDRSGRFEDVYVTATRGIASLTVGQFRQIEQEDVSLRLGLSEPLSLSASVPGAGDGTARQRSLRGFAPAARSPALRLALRQPLGPREAWTWTGSAGVPLPGELSIPLTREARVEASNEVEWRAKGIVLESYLRRGLFTAGGHVFYDDADRSLAQGVSTGGHGRLHWTAVGGVERSGDVTRGRWSVEGSVVPSRFAVLGGRIEDRAGDGAPRALVPYLRAHFPGTRYTIYVAAEQRVQRGRNATFMELGTVF